MSIPESFDIFPFSKNCYERFSLNFVLTVPFSVIKSV
jgi:hypothetical protein